MQNLKVVLTQHPFFKGLDESYLNLMTGCASNVRFNPGEFIFHEGEDANEFYLIREGKISLEIHAPPRGTIKIETLGEGSVLGWSWLLPPYKKHFDARALELTRAFRLDCTCIRDKCEQDPKMGYELLKRFASLIGERLQATRLRLLDMYGEAPAGERS